MVDAPVAITNDDEPARAVRDRPDSSLVQAARAVGAGEADAVVSAGPTGALMAASLFHLKRMKGVHRPAAAVLLPVPGRPALLLDSGANVEVRSRVPRPVRLHGLRLHGGRARRRAPARGAALERARRRRRARRTWSRRTSVWPAARSNFVGNIEGGDVVAGELDVVVTDGFTGNVALKAIEGTAKMVSGTISQCRAARTPVATLGGLLIARTLGAHAAASSSQDDVGGGIMLGLRGVAVAAHGSASATGIANAVRLAQRAVDERMVERTEAALRGRRRPSHVRDPLLASPPRDD